MVTQNATSTEETQVSPNPVAQPPVDTSESEDGPLIPRDDTGLGWDDESVGAEQTEEGDAESPEDGAASTEAEPEEPTAETETSEEPEAEAESETEARTYTAEEWNKRQSAIDKQIADARREAAEARAQVEQINQRAQEQSIQAQVLAFRDQIRDSLLDQGYDEKTALAQADSQTRVIKAAWDADQARQKAEAELNALKQSAERTSASTVARDMASKYNVSADDIKYLVQAPNPQAMEEMAQRFGALNTQLQEQTERLQAEVPADDQLDTGGGRGGMTDADKVAAYSRGEYNDHAEIQKILARQGMSPF